MGMMDKIKQKVSNEFKERKNEALQRRAAEKLIKQKSQAEYYRAKEKEEFKLARQKAVYERKQKYKALSTPKQSFGFGGFSGGVLNSSGRTNSLNELLGMNKPISRTKTSKRHIGPAHDPLARIRKLKLY